VKKFKKYLALSGLVLSGWAFGQPANDDCFDAERLCPGTVLSGTTVDATTNSASDDNFCFVPSSTVWYKFTTNSSGGLVTIHFTNLVFDPAPAKGQSLQSLMYQVTSECDKLTYTPFTLCGDGGTDYDITSAVACAANTTYWVVVNGTTSGAGVTEHADATFDIGISGPGIDATFPTVSISILDDSFCQGVDEPVDRTISACGDTVLMDWYVDGSLFLSTTVDSFSTTMLTDTSDVYLIVHCDAICNLSDTSNTITINVTPIAADAGPDKFIEEGESVTIDGSGSGTPVWTPDTWLSPPDSFTPVAIPPDDVTYFLTVTNGPCTATDEMNIFVGSVIVVYSCFTPNSDGTNDKWSIVNSAQFPNMEVNVYDRSGQKVFNANSYDTSDKWWDGTNKNGQPLPASAYYYVIDLKDPDAEQQVYKGMVTIIR
jgi:gliding motility-associated-like protein